MDEELEEEEEEEEEEELEDEEEELELSSSSLSPACINTCSNNRQIHATIEKAYVCIVLHSICNL